MDDPVENCVGDRRIREEAVPLIGRVLTGDEQRAAAHSSVDDIEKYLGDVARDFAQSEIVDDDQIWFDQLQLESR